MTERRALLSLPKKKEFAPPPPRSPKKTGTNTWKERLATLTFFFSGVDKTIQAQLTKELKSLGSTVCNFLQKGAVTHMVVDNRTYNDYFDTKGKPLARPSISKANNHIEVATSLGIRIWPCNKLDLIVKAVLKDENHDKRGLANVVQREQMYGIPTNKDPATSKGEFHHFKGPYMLVDDLSGKYRSVLVKEYKNDQPLPIIYPKSRCAFLNVPMNCHSIDSCESKDALPQCDQKEEEPAANTASMASGLISGSVTTLMRRDPKPNDALNKLGNRTIQPPTRSKKKVLQEKPKPQPKATGHVQFYEKSGYCENCHVKYENYLEHTESYQHRMWAKDSSNFEELDRFFNCLRRPLKNEEPIQKKIDRFQQACHTPFTQLHPMVSNHALLMWAITHSFHLKSAPEDENDFIGYVKTLKKNTSTFLSRLLTRLHHAKKETLASEDPKQATPEERIILEELVNDIRGENELGKLEYTLLMADAAAAMVSGEGMSSYSDEEKEANEEEEEEEEPEEEEDIDQPQEKEDDSTDSEYCVNDSPTSALRSHHICNEMDENGYPLENVEDKENVAPISIHETTPADETGEPSMVDESQYKTPEKSLFSSKLQSTVNKPVESDAPIKLFQDESSSLSDIPDEMLKSDDLPVVDMNSVVCRSPSPKTGRKRRMSIYGTPNKRCLLVNTDSPAVTIPPETPNPFWHTPDKDIKTTPRRNRTSLPLTPIQKKDATPIIEQQPTIGRMRGFSSVRMNKNS